MTAVAVLVTSIVVVTVSTTSIVDADAVIVFAGPVVVVVVVHTSVVPVLRDAGQCTSPKPPFLPRRIYIRDTYTWHTTLEGQACLPSLRVASSRLGLLLHTVVALFS